MHKCIYLSVISSNSNKTVASFKVLVDMNLNISGSIKILVLISNQKVISVQLYYVLSYSMCRYSCGKTGCASQPFVISYKSNTHVLRLAVYPSHL